MSIANVSLERRRRRRWWLVCGCKHDIRTVYICICLTMLVIWKAKGNKAPWSFVSMANISWWSFQKKTKMGKRNPGIQQTLGIRTSRLSCEPYYFSSNDPRPHRYFEIIQLRCNWIGGRLHPEIIHLLHNGTMIIDTCRPIGDVLGTSINGQVQQTSEPFCQWTAFWKCLHDVVRCSTTQTLH